MSYPSIIAIIDARLERLETARALLLASPVLRPVPMTKPARSARLAKSDASSQSLVDLEEVQEVLSQVAGTAEPLLSPPGAEQQELLPEVIQTTLHPMRKRREVRAVSKPQPLAPSALSGPAPSTPVYVPAEKVRDAQVRIASRLAAAAAPNEAITAEMLSRRWLNG
ncbi:hypothetical protein [Acidipila sp. EB88]|uniref:hypothetical protein n=1 Tax=Acidipila sp. EB88 TaxID=2305226 RepID=UPI000F5E65A7|nr:hypothetical protein [Acidipila sp. EB88]RRA47959.1 hypothetical protein D1Y84_06320 [Acidipila sp. EB88]